MAKKNKRQRFQTGSSSGLRQRHVEFREVRQRFLIVCEGEKTEPNYFNGFRAPGVVVDVTGLGNSPRQLVEEALKRRKQDEYDQVWCVFDRDDCKVSDFNGTLDRARSQKISVAYSNQAFELWYLLHYDFHNTAVPRQDYRKKLRKSLGRDYRKNDPHMYNQLSSHQDTAIEHAERLLKEYSPRSPSTDDPSTTVHLLVKQLRLFT